MLELTAIFESWHIGDGNYPPFHKGMAVNLSFQLEPDILLPAETSMEMSFIHSRFAEFDFCGKILRIYRDSELAIIDCKGFRFYIEESKLKKFKEGMMIKGKGTLLLDYYIWAESLSRRKNPPDIFFTLEVTRIRQVKIPEQFIHRFDQGWSFPTRYKIDDDSDIVELETMEGQKFLTEFYLVDFKELDRKDIPKTFI